LTSCRVCARVQAVGADLSIDLKRKETTMKNELFYLTLVTAFTGLLWLPYILDRLAVRGIADAVGYPENPKPQSPWAQRLMKAHANAVENLAVFATLVLVAHALGLSNSVIATASMVYFWARVVHALAYTFAVPWVRTLSFAVGFFAQAAIAWQMLMR
jgi:uncharacterized MAPEG superfamily protein